MKDKMIKELSDISRTNQLKITETSEEIAEKLYQYLFKLGKGIEYFAIQNDWFTKEEYSNTNFYKIRHKRIKTEIKQRLSSYTENLKDSEVQYFLSHDKKNVFFLSPNKNHSGWKNLFKNNQEKIINLVFKFYILSQNLAVETINGFEELLLIHSQKISKDALIVWGQNLSIKYNYHNVLTLTLTRKNLRFLPKDKYSTLDGDDIGELLVYKNKNYYFDRLYDARRSNSIDFMRFDKDFDKFKKTQLYNYQSIISKLEGFLSEWGISFQSLHFQADHYLENSFIKNIESVESLEIINNTGVDLTVLDQQFLKNFLHYQGEISLLTFYNSGKTISKYEKVEIEGEDNSYWKIYENVEWSSIKLEREKNYLVLNKLLDRETGSIAYQRNDGFWYPSIEVDKRDGNKVDFYSQLKKKINYLETGTFFSMQGIDIPEFVTIGDENSSLSVLSYATKAVDQNILSVDTQDFTDGLFLDVSSSISCYLSNQKNIQEWEKFYDKYKIKISPEYEKTLIEIGIKNWLKQNLINPNFGLSISAQSFSEKQFVTIYVRSPFNAKAQAVAIEFLYKDSYIYIKNIIRDMKEIEDRFRFLKRKRNKSEKLIDNQQYFVDESAKIYISYYTNDLFTPMLIGRNDILEDMENGNLKINRQIKGENSSKLLPLVTYYNSNINPINRIQNMICLDLGNESFIQYFVPSAKSINNVIKKGFRVYHLIGKTYSDQPIPTSELIQHPITSLHFTTLTQNILKISDNSQSSLLHKVAKVLIDN
jgi:hypothetical protein